MTCVGSLSCQSFGPQPFQIFAQRDLLLLVFGQRAVRWTECVVGVIFAFAHDVTFRKRPQRLRVWLNFTAASPYCLHDDMETEAARARKDQGRTSRDAGEGRPQHAASRRT